MIINKTKLPAEEISLAIEEAISFFLSIYPDATPSLDYNIILCDDFQSLEEEWRAYYGHEEDAHLPLSYDGQFLPPTKKTATLTMLVRINRDVIVGAEQYHTEMEYGREEPSETRGLMLIPFFMFLELLLHEFSHLCSYGRMMSLTAWADPQLPSHNLDYHLHDEFIARIRGTEAMLRMVKDLLEPDLIYSLYVNYVNDVKQQYLDRMEEVKGTVAKARTDLEAELPEMQKRQGMSLEDMVIGLEEELGHRLEFGIVDGKVKLSDLEVIEFDAVDELEEKLKPYLYVLRNQYAVYEGTQFTGALVGFYLAFCTPVSSSACADNDKRGWELQLESVINTPFWKYMDVETVKEQDGEFRDWLIEHAGG